MNRQQKRAHNRAKRDARYQDTKAMSMDERIRMKLVRDKSIDIAVHDMTQINVMLMFTAAAEVFGAGARTARPMRRLCWSANAPRFSVRTSTSIC